VRVCLFMFVLCEGGEVGLCMCVLCKGGMGGVCVRACVCVRVGVCTYVHMYIYIPSRYNIYIMSYYTPCPTKALRLRRWTFSPSSSSSRQRLPLKTFHVSLFFSSACLPAHPPHVSLLLHLFISPFFSSSCLPAPSPHVSLLLLLMSQYLSSSSMLQNGWSGSNRSPSGPELSLLVWFTLHDDLGALNSCTA